MNDLREVATFVEREPRSSLILATLRESALIRDAFRLTATAVFVREAAVVTGTADGSAATTLREVASLGDAAYPRSKVTSTLRERAALADRTHTRALLTQDLRETAAVRGEAQSGNPRADTRETAALGDLATVTVHRRSTVRESAVLRDRARPLSRVDERETAVLNDNAAPVLRHRPVTRETAVLGDQAEIVLRHRATLRETAAVGDNAAPRLTARQSVRERAWVRGDVETPRSDVAWTANIASWAMSRYGQFPFNSIAGDFAAAESGLYAPGGELFAASITTGDEAFGTTARKAVESLYADGTHETPLTLSVSADSRGSRETHEYQQMPRDASDDRLVRIQVGKGFRSQYYRFKISSDEAFKLNRLDVLLHASNRRI